MNLDDARALAEAWIEQHGLHGWRFTFDRAVRRFGQCDYLRRTISLSAALTELNDEHRVENTILHEIAHALTPGANHGPEWKRVAASIGCDAQRCDSDIRGQRTASSAARLRRHLPIVRQHHSTLPPPEPFVRGLRIDIQPAASVCMDEGRAMNPQPIDILLPLLHRVRRRSQDRWLASCPTTAHENGDQHPSLGIHECPDGVVLLKCYSMNCDPRSVMQALGLELRDLFPRRVSDLVRARDGELTAWDGRNKPRTDRLPLRDVLLVIRRETMVITLASDRIQNGIALTPDDHARVCLAQSRIRNGLEAAGVR